jgi:ribonuclease P protein component
MLPAGSRLRRRPEFGAVLRRGRRAGTARLVVHLEVPAPASRTDGVGGSASAPRAGFVVGRAVGGAVVRNQVRRRLRHLVAVRLPGLPGTARLVVRALPGAAEASSAQLGADLDRALGQALRGRAA